MNRFTAATLGVAFLHMAVLPAHAQAEPAAAPVPDRLLAQARGMADVRLVEQSTTVSSTSTVEGNSITGDFTTGLVNIGTGALDNFNGLALFNINTGNNVAINSAMTVNVAIQP
ncbi:hypothetical protein [Sphingobium sp.]|uniref:hypothetical protein n=1 Tax=Sphingobium sp. TaxID=1912891 RepID=UPI0035C760FF